MTTVSLRSLVPEIMNFSDNPETFDADYKRLQRMHKLFCGITGKEYSTQIEVTAKAEYVALMRTLLQKFATTDAGAQIEKIIRKQGKNNERVTLPQELDDILLSWFEAAYMEVALKSDDEEVMARYQSILIQKENEGFLQEIHNIVEDDLMQMWQVQDDKALNHLLATYKELLQSEAMREHRKLIHLAKKVEQSVAKKLETDKEQ